MRISRPENCQAFCRFGPRRQVSFHVTYLMVVRNPASVIMGTNQKPHMQLSITYRLLFYSPVLFFCAANASAAVVDVLGALSPGDFSAYIAPQTYRDWGNEPSVAVNPTNPQEIIISSFAYGSWVSSSTAQLWHSTDGGNSWFISFAMPTPFPSSTFFIDDQVFAFDGAGTLHCALLAYDSSSGSDSVYHGVTSDPNTSAAWTWNNTPVAADNASGFVDQPWIAISGNTVAVAYDNFNSSFTFSEERVAISTDFGVTFSAGLNQAVCAPGRVNTSIVNPGLRIAADALGDVFMLCGMRTNNNLSGIPLINYRLNRFSAGGSAWDFTSATPDAIGGLAITNGPSRQGNSSTFSFGGINYLLGNLTAIAVNTNGTRVYVVYGMSDVNSINHLYLQRLQPSGSNLVLSGPPLNLSSANFSAALPSVAVADNGVVGFMFDEFDGAAFHIHLAISYDEGASIATNADLYTFSTNGMAFGYGTTPSSHNRLLGDYARMIAYKNVFYGTFAGRGNVSAGSNITTNDICPFFFSRDVSLAQPIIVDIFRTGINVQLDFSGTPGAAYYVQATSSLSPPVAWQDVSTNVASVSTGQWSYTQPTSAFSRRFFRASQKP